MGLFLLSGNAGAIGAPAVPQPEDGPPPGPPAALPDPGTPPEPRSAGARSPDRIPPEPVPESAPAPDGSTLLPPPAELEGPPAEEGGLMTPVRRAGNPTATPDGDSAPSFGVPRRGEGR